MSSALTLRTGAPSKPGSFDAIGDVRRRCERLCEFRIPFGFLGGGGYVFGDEAGFCGADGFRGELSKIGRGPHSGLGEFDSNAADISGSSSSLLDFREHHDRIHFPFAGFGSVASRRIVAGMVQPYLSDPAR